MTSTMMQHHNLRHTVKEDSTMHVGGVAGLNGGGGGGPRATSNSQDNTQVLATISTGAEANGLFQSAPSGSYISGHYNHQHHNYHEQQHLQLHNQHHISSNHHHHNHNIQQYNNRLQTEPLITPFETAQYGNYRDENSNNNDNTNHHHTRQTQSFQNRFQQTLDVHTHDGNCFSLQDQSNNQQMINLDLSVAHQTDILSRTASTSNKGPSILHHIGRQPPPVSSASSESQSTSSSINVTYNTPFNITPTTATNTTLARSTNYRNHCQDDQQQLNLIGGADNENHQQQYTPIQYHYPLRSSSTTSGYHHQTGGESSPQTSDDQLAHNNNRSTRGLQNEQYARQSNDDIINRRIDQNNSSNNSQSELVLTELTKSNDQLINNNQTTTTTTKKRKRPLESAANQQTSCWPNEIEFEHNNNNHQFSQQAQEAKIWPAAEFQQDRAGRKSGVQVKDFANSTTNQREIEEEEEKLARARQSSIATEQLPTGGTFANSYLRYIYQGGSSSVPANQEHDKNNNGANEDHLNNNITNNNEDDDDNTTSAGNQLKLEPDLSANRSNSAASLGATEDNNNSEIGQLRVLEMRKEKSRDAARSRRSKENHEFYELGRLLPLPSAITSQLDFLDKASIIRLTISFLKLRQFSVNGFPPWVPDFTTPGSVNPYSSHVTSYQNRFQSQDGNIQEQQNSRPASGLSIDHKLNNKSLSLATSLAYRHSSNNIVDTHNSVRCLPSDQQSSSTPIAPSNIAFSHNIDPYAHVLSHSKSIISRSNQKNHLANDSQPTNYFDEYHGTHILQSLDGFAFAIGRDGRFLYISETVSMYLGLSQVEMTGSSVFDYTHQQDHAELARHLGLSAIPTEPGQKQTTLCDSPQPASVRSQYSAASNETFIDDYINTGPRKRQKGSRQVAGGKTTYSRNDRKPCHSKSPIKLEPSTSVILRSQDDFQRPINDSTSDEIYEKSREGFESISKKDSNDDPMVRQFSIRMKSTLTKRGCQHFKSSGYRVVHVIGRLRSYQSNDNGHLVDPLDEPAHNQIIKQSSKRQTLKHSPNKDIPNTKETKSSDDNSISDIYSGESALKPKIIGMVAVAIALPPPSISEVKLESDTFVLRLSLDLKVTHIEPKITEILHYPVELIAGQSFYGLVHPADLRQLQKCHHDLLKKGQTMSGYYRILTRNGGYIWIQTCATLICNTSLSNQTQPILPISPISIPVQTQLPSSGPLSSSEVGQGKLASPSLSSHYSSGFENLDQDQCVIFVNHMITDCLRTDDIMDICQSANYSPISQYPGSMTKMTSFDPVSLSCKSPCSTQTKISPSIITNNSYSTTSSPSINTSPPKRQVNMPEVKGRDARQAKRNSKVRQHQHQNMYSGNEDFSANGLSVNEQTTRIRDFNSVDVLCVRNSQMNKHNSEMTDQVNYGYHQQTSQGGVNLALGKAQQPEPSWLASGQSNRFADANVVYPTAHTSTDHYNRSIYKAAFGLDVASATPAYGAHQQPGNIYQVAVGSAGAGYGAHSGVTNTWDPAAAAVAVVASNLSTHNQHNNAHHLNHHTTTTNNNNHNSSSDNNNNNNHHHQHQSNLYTQFENHTHHQTNNNNNNNINNHHHHPHHHHNQSHSAAAPTLKFRLFHIVKFGCSTCRESKLSTSLDEIEQTNVEPSSHILRKRILSSITEVSEERILSWEGSAHRRNRYGPYIQPVINRVVTYFFGAQALEGESCPIRPSKTKKSVTIDSGDKGTEAKPKDD